MSGKYEPLSSSGIVESDDVVALIGEMETAVNYWQKVRTDNHFKGSIALHATLQPTCI